MHCLKCHAGHGNLLLEEELTLRGVVCHFRCALCGWRSGFIIDNRKPFVEEFDFPDNVTITFKGDQVEVINELLAISTDPAEDICAIIEYYKNGGE